MAERLIDTLPHPEQRKIVFIDLEASGLGSKSWPLEVGWAFEEGPPQSTLIKPDTTWSDDAWEAEAEKLHGITRARLHAEGAEAREVCTLLNRTLCGAEVYSDAPDWDGFWLFRLFSAAGVRQAFALFDYGRLLKPLAGSSEPELLERAVRLAPRRHRAAADALHLQTLYRLASESCAPTLTR